MVRAHVLHDIAKRDESISKSSLPKDWTRSQQNSVQEYDDWAPVPPTTARSGMDTGRSIIKTKTKPLQRELEVR